MFDGFEGGAFDFDAHGGAHAALEHDEAGGDGLEPGGGGGAGDFAGLYDFVPDVVG